MQIINYSKRTFDTDIQAIETSDNSSARRFLIHGVENAGYPLSLHGLFLKAKSAQQSANKAQSKEFIKVYKAAHRSVSDGSYSLKRADELLCSSIAFVRIFDVVCFHIYSLQPLQQRDLERSPAVSELYSYLDELFPHVNTSKRKNQLRDAVVNSHPARAGCSAACTIHKCSSAAGLQCRKSTHTTKLVDFLNNPDTSYESALDGVRKFLVDGSGTAHCCLTFGQHIPYTLLLKMNFWSVAFR